MIDDENYRLNIFLSSLCVSREMPKEDIPKLNLGDKSYVEIF